jgi:hypothetical protein
MSDCISVGTPITAKPPQVDNPNDPIGNDVTRPYVQLVGKLLYFANWTRPDIAAATSLNPHILIGWMQAKRVLRYLNGTKDTCLTYFEGISPEPICWQDASYADGDERKSRTGLVAMICGATVLWAVRLQPTTALSTVEAEYMALAAAAQECGFIR